jgi:hypothetical protein
MNTADRSGYHSGTGEARARAELERTILLGLGFEWDAALWVLSASYRKRMRAPLFSLREMKGKWGYWSAENREIRLSRKLVLDHPWNAVREVLHHEMAHQLAEEVLGAGQESPHGPTFQEAACLLRANPRASGDFPLPEERIFSRESHRDEDRVLLRVKKLLALAESRNRHEAEAAMGKAHELILKYNLDLSERHGDREFESVFVGRPALRHPREEYQLARLLQDFYFVRGIWMPSFVLEKAKMGRVLEISGTIQNIEMASYVHQFVWHFIQARWQDYNSDKRLNRYRKTDFATGIIEGFRSKLESMRKTEKRPGQALIKLEDPQLNRFFKYKYPNTVSFRPKGGMQDDEIVKEGVSLGKKLVIFKGITSRGTKERPLLGNRER